MPCFRREADGIVLSARLTPRANHDSIDGIGAVADGAEVLLARVRAIPADGAANRALMALVAETFGLPKSALTMVRGATARLKHIRITGEPERLIAIVARLRKK